MRYYALALGVALLIPRSSYAGNVATTFHFKMITDSGVEYTYDDNPFKLTPIMLPGAFAFETWRCEREPIILNNIGSGYVGEILCISDHGATWSSALCSSSHEDHDAGGFHLSVRQDGKVISVQFVIGCTTSAVPTNSPPPKVNKRKD